MPEVIAGRRAAGQSLAAVVEELAAGMDEGHGGWLAAGLAALANHVQRSTHVLFEVELALERVVDRLDDLPQRLEELAAGPGLLAFAGRAQQVHSGFGEGGFELPAVVVLVRDQDLPGSLGTRQAGSVSRMASRVWRSSAFAPVNANPTGSPCTVTWCRA
jgi:hypothetical protein